MRLSRKASLLLAVVLVALPWAGASSQQFPARPIRIVLGTVAGSGVDLAARMLADKMREALGQPVVVENKSGADGIVAARYVAAAAPDGYTLMLASNGTLAVNAVLHDRPPYDPVRDFAPISMVARYSIVLVVGPTVPVNSLRELVAYSKAHPDQLNYGSTSATYTFATEQLKKLTGADLHQIPYNGSPAVVAALLAGDVQVAVLNVLSTSEHIRSGRLRALAVLNAEREPRLPLVPTIAEAGLRGYDFDVWTALFAPGGTAPDIVARLHEVVARILESPDVRERFAAAGLVPMSSRPEFVRDLIVRDLSSYAELVKSMRDASK